MSSEVVRGLGTIADRPRMACPKHVGKTPSEQNDADRKDDKKKLDAWKRGVWKRDGVNCRCCDRKVFKILEAVPERGECHHIAGRADTAVRYDVRNGLLVCLTCHEKIERYQIHLVQKAAFMFSVDGVPRKYLNGSKDIKFIKKEAA